jgi:hypothetical protein
MSVASPISSAKYFHTIPEDDNLELSGLSSELCSFYKKHGILDNPSKPLEVDLETLNLSLEEIEEEECEIIKTWDSTSSIPETPTTLKVAIEEVIAAINEQLELNCHQFTIKERRTIHLYDQPSHRKLFFYSHFYGCTNGDPEEKDGVESPSWLSRILDALLNKGHIFEILPRDANGYVIQI